MVWGREDDDHGGAPEADALVHGQMLRHISLSHPGAQSGDDDCVKVSSEKTFVFQVDKVSFSPDNQLVFAASYKVSLLNKQEQESPENEMS